MRLVLVGMILLAATVANAQPYAQPPPPQPYYPQPYPTYYAPPAAQQQVHLTVDEQWLLSRGYITQGEHLGGGVVSLFFGFGVGQAVQGRWAQKGYIFTVGEIASFGAMIYGMAELFSACHGTDDPYYEEPCNHSAERRGATMLIGGALALSVFRIWEIVDAFTAPSEHNRQLRALRGRLGYQDGYARVRPYVAPAGDSGGVAGISMRF
jgi:hypothetical protein